MIVDIIQAQLTLDQLDQQISAKEQQLTTFVASLMQPDSEVMLFGSLGTQLS
jgi:hypothetical protein